MIKSIKYFLLISLLLSITVASTINGITNYILDERTIQPFLDSRLVRSASLIDILIHSTRPDSKARKEFINYLRTKQPVTGQEIFFQVWDQKHNLVINSLTQRQLSFRDAPLGFSNREIDNELWRMYATYSNQSDLKIVVGELTNLRRKLTDDISQSNTNILLITYPVFAILVWIIISLALRSITRVTNEISNRASTFLEPVELEAIPVEIKPLVAELNQLFIRLKLAFDRNKRFAADAAHELRTPLAALKTHAQLALIAENESDKNKALQKVIESVDRSSHVVAQLLTLSRLGEEEGLTDIKLFDLHKLAIEIIALLAPQALEKNIEIELHPSPQNAIILGNEIAIGILIRNVVDNAIRYTPPQGHVEVAIIEEKDWIILRVIDSGPGIPLELRERVFERFFRILGTKTSGSGLGLAIVGQIASLHHARIQLDSTPSGVGLQFDVAFPKYHA